MRSLNAVRFYSRMQLRIGNTRAYLCVCVCACVSLSLRSMLAAVKQTDVFLLEMEKLSVINKEHLDDSPRCDLALKASL